MKCKFCHKPLPEEKDIRCPHCFAAWTPEEDAEKNMPVKAGQEEEE